LRLPDPANTNQAPAKLRATSFSDEELHRSVNDEWSTVGLLGHVVLIIDLWLSKAISSAR
jgi:hypothetical protein